MHDIDALARNSGISLLIARQLGSRSIGKSGASQDHAKAPLLKSGPDLEPSSSPGPPPQKASSLGVSPHPSPTPSPPLDTAKCSTPIASLTPAPVSSRTLVTKIKLENGTRSSTKRSVRLSKQNQKPKLVATRVPTPCPGDSFKDLVLGELKIDSYYVASRLEEKALEIIQLASTSLESQIDAFIYDSRQFLAISWLGSVRLFEYLTDDLRYAEVKRIPDRFIQPSQHLITSMHFSDDLFYIAYLWGGEVAAHKDDQTKALKPHIEVRNIFGRMVNQPFYYDEEVTRIYSDQNFIYARQKRMVYLHRRDFFHTIYYIVDLSSLVTGSVSSLWCDAPVSLPYTKLTAVMATTDELVVMLYEQIHPCIRHIFKFYDALKIVSVNKLDQTLIVHRNLSDFDHWDDSQATSKIDMGFLSTSKKLDTYFIHQVSISLYYRILQVKAHSAQLYLLGCSMGAEDSTVYEVGCLSVADLRPVWITYVEDIDADCHMLVHNDHIVIVKKSQNFTFFRKWNSKKIECLQCGIRFLKSADKNRHEKSNHASMFSRYNVSCNEYLQQLRAEKYSTPNGADPDEKSSS